MSISFSVASVRMRRQMSSVKMVALELKMEVSEDIRADSITASIIPRAPGKAWWRHQMERFSALLTICARNSPVTGEFPTQRPATRSSNVFFNMCLNKPLSKQSGGWWLRRHCAHYGVTVMGQKTVHYRDVTGAAWRLKPPTDRLFVKQFIPHNNEENTKTPHHRHFERDSISHQWFPQAKDQ